MSYDYIIFRALVELEELKSITSPHLLAQGDWSIEASAVLAQIFPSISWGNGPLRAAPATDTGGRFELAITCTDNVTAVHVEGSRHVNQVHLVQRCATALQGYAFDLQTGERVWPMHRNDT